MDDQLINDFKKHINFEDDMDDSMFSTYLSYASGYVLSATGKSSRQLILMVAAILNDWRVPDEDLDTALKSLTPFFVGEVYADGTATEPADTHSQINEDNPDQGR